MSPLENPTRQQASYCFEEPRYYVHPRSLFFTGDETKKKFDKRKHIWTKPNERPLVFLSPAEELSFLWRSVPVLVQTQRDLDVRGDDDRALAD